MTWWAILLVAIGGLAVVYALVVVLITFNKVIEYIKEASRAFRL